VVVAVDAEIADQRRDLLDRRNLRRNPVDLDAPARRGIGRDHRVGDIGQFAEIGLRDLVADVEDDEVVAAGIGLEPFGGDERGDILRLREGGRREAGEQDDGRREAHGKLREDVNQMPRS
jgi:hypothetical protein